MSNRLSILLLADDQKGAPNTIHDHIGAFRRYSRHRVQTVNPRNLVRSRFLDLNEFDVVVVHYSLVVIQNDYLSPWFREQIAAYDGLKVQFLQDEYRWVDDITAQLREMGTNVLYSVIDHETAPAVYGDRLPDTEILFTLTGYVPEGISGPPTPPLATRPVDIGYRGRSLPFWLGRLGHEKIEVGRCFLAEAERFDLVTDIAWSESARIYGDRWTEWMRSCKAMLASESGSSIVDWDRSAEDAVRAHLSAHPTALYEEVEAAVLGPYASSPVIHTVSPRVFETAAAGTAMVMFPGEYSGVVQADLHYIPLTKDFSNIDGVVEKLHDLRYLEELTRRAYDDLIASGRYSYRRFIQQFDEDMEARASSGRRGRFPRVRLRLEEASTGRTYYISVGYNLARALLLRYIGIKHVVRRRALGRLALLAGRRRAGEPEGSTTLWDDLFRVAMLTSIHEGALVPASDDFDVVPTFEAGQLTFTSRSPGGNASPSVREAVRDSLQARRLDEIVWNHAAVGQFVTMRLPLVDRRISFDVGRYDAYGVYRFNQLVEVARDAPDLVLAALEPLLGTDPPIPTRNDSEDSR